LSKFISYVKVGGQASPDSGVNRLFFVVVNPHRDSNAATHCEWTAWQQHILFYTHEGTQTHVYVGRNVTWNEVEAKLPVPMDSWRVSNESGILRRRE